MSNAHYLPRAADDRFDWLLANYACVRITGPRSVGKTTTARRRARRRYDMSDPTVRREFERNAATLLRTPPYPILIDEWQLHRDLLWDIKRVVEASDQAGMFILAGSPTWRGAPDQGGPWPLGNKGVDVEMVPLSISEQEGRGAPTFIRTAFEVATPSSGEPAQSIVERFSEARERQPATAGASSPRWFDLALRSGYPALLGVVGGRQRGDLDAILNLAIGNDVSMDVDREKFLAFMQVCAQHSSEPVAPSTLAETIHVTGRAAEAFGSMASNAGLIHRVAPWSSALRGSSREHARQYIADPGLCGQLARLSRGQERRDSAVKGALLETFVVAQARAELTALPNQYHLGHFRDRAGEVDLILEDEDSGAVLAIEVKSRAHARAKDTATMRRLRDELAAKPDAGVHFTLGIVLHTGNQAETLGDPRLVSLPVDVWWAQW